MPSLGTAEGGVLTLQHYSGCVRCLAGLGVALLVCVACRGEVTPVEQVLAEVGGRSHTCPRARALTLALAAPAPDDAPDDSEIPQNNPTTT